ncbi:DNA polymerase III subunit [Oceanithermus sp.]
MIEVIGHEQQRRLLAAKPAQSYLFVGPEGVGRRTVARWFAYGLNCERGFPPCGECASCRLEKHPDYLEISPRTTTRSGQTARRPQIRLEQIAPREGSEEPSLIEWMQTAPRFKAKVAVIDSAHLLGEQAANALLKLLEEPPSYGYVVLIAPVREAVLPTLASRSLTIGFGPAPMNELRRITSDEAALGYSEGAVGRLLKALAEPEKLRAAEDAAVAWLEALGDPAALLAQTRRLEQTSGEGFDPWVFVARRLESWPAAYRLAALEELQRLREELSAYVSAELAYTRLALAMRRIYAEMRSGSPVSR